MSKTRREIYAAMTAFVLCCTATVQADLFARVMTAPRLKEADTELGEGMLEAFGTTYLPNSYARYQEVREAAKKKEAVLRQNFPEGRASDTSGGELYDELAPVVAKAVAEKKRRHDELCHFYLLHQAGVITDAELVKVDSSEIPIAFSQVEKLVGIDAPAKPTEEERAFAGKYLPAALSSYDRLAENFMEGMAVYDKLDADATKIGTAHGGIVLKPLAERLNEIRSRLDKLALEMRRQRLRYGMEAITAEQLAVKDRELSDEIVPFEKRLPVRDYVRARWAEADDISVVNSSPDGRVSVEFTDMSARPPQSYLLKVGEKREGCDWFVVDADIERRRVTLSKGGLEFVFQLRNADLDGDGLPDAWEKKYGLNPCDPADADQDADGDMFTNLEEFQAKTNPKDPEDHSDYLKDLVIAGDLRTECLPFWFKSYRPASRDGYRVEFAVNDRQRQYRPFATATLGEEVVFELMKIKYVKGRAQDDKVKTGWRVLKVNKKEKLVTRPGSAQQFTVDASTVDLERIKDGRVISLELGARSVPIGEQVDLRWSRGDGKAFTVSQGSEFTLANRTYRVKALKRGRVTLVDLKTGKERNIE